MTLPETIIVMLVWANGYGNTWGMTKFEGFQTMAACEAAIPIISSHLLKQINHKSTKIKAECVEMKAR